MRITINPTTYAEWWTGSRTINIYTLNQYLNQYICDDAVVRAWGPRWANTDCISFGYDKPDNTTTQLEMLAVLIRHLEDVYFVDECPHTEWRWLDCEACRDSGDTCDVKVCVECGSSLMGEEA